MVVMPPVIDVLNAPLPPVQVMAPVYDPISREVQTVAAFGEEWFCCPFASSAYLLGTEGVATAPVESLGYATWRSPDATVVWEWPTHTSALFSSAFIAYDIGGGFSSLYRELRVFNVVSNVATLVAAAYTSVSLPSPGPAYTDPVTAPPTLQHFMSFHRSASEPWFYESFTWGDFASSQPNVTADWVTTGALPYILDGETGALPTPTYMGYTWGPSPDDDGLCKVDAIVTACDQWNGENPAPYNPVLNVFEITPAVG